MEAPQRPEYPIRRTTPPPTSWWHVAEVATRTGGTPGSLLSFKMGASDAAQHRPPAAYQRAPAPRKSGNQQRRKATTLYTGIARVPNFWMENPHTARYITNPSGDVKKITGCYYRSVPWERKFDIEIPSDESLLRGKYKTYTIDGATGTKSDRGSTPGRATST